MPSGEAIVKKALDQLLSTLLPDDKREFSRTTLQDVKQCAYDIEREQAARLDLRFMRRIEPLLRSLETYAPVLEVFCQGYAPMAFIWGPIKLMLLLARQYSSVMEKILQAFCDIAENIPRVDRLQATFGNDKDFQQVLGLIYSDLTEFHRRAYKFFRRKAWHIWFAFDWGLFERRFKSIVQRLSQHCDILDREAAVLHFSEMKTEREKRHLEEEEFERRRQIQMVQEVFAWLSKGEDHQEDYLHRLSDNRQAGTCDWVLEDPQVHPWINDDIGHSLLWMTGIPGAGKSYLCSLIVSHLETYQDVSTLYYFCGNQPSDRLTCTTILRILAVQLVRQNIDMAPLIHQAYLQKGSFLSGSTMRKMLIEVLSTVKPTRVILDGIDECDHATQQDVLGSLLELNKRTGDNFRLLISSRKEPLIQNAIRKAMASKNHLQLEQKTTEGLHAYVRNQVQKLKARFSEKDPKVLERVENRLQTKAKGMFLWVRLVSTMLEQEVSDVEFEAAIERLPDGLHEAYGLIISRIRDMNPSVRNRVFKILSWVCVAYRQISIHEITDGIALNADQTMLSKKTRITDPDRDIVDICAPLLEKSNNGTVDVVHFSAKEYLLHEQSGRFIDPRQGHFNVAFSCITNLATAVELVPEYKAEVSESNLEASAAQGRYGLQPYGHQFWAEHLTAYLENPRESDDEDLKLISALQAFSELVCKYPPADTYSDGFKTRLCVLGQYPKLLNFVSSWLHFKSKFEGTRPLFSSVRDQEQWRRQNDGTYLSLMNTRFHEIKESLLAMRAASPPAHIERNDFQAFVNRYSFNCRSFGCDHASDNIQERDDHETSHQPSFPCLQCDFYVSKSRKGLAKHTQKYHMSPDDFQIPSSLHEAAMSSGSASTAARSTYRSRTWNAQGRKVLERGFRQFVSRLEAEVASAFDKNLLTTAEQAGNENAENSRDRLVEMDASVTMLNGVRDRIERHDYQSLNELKFDLCTTRGTAAALGNAKKVESSCDQAFENAVCEFEAFASFEDVKPISRNLLDVSEEVEAPIVDYNETDFETLHYHGKRTPYWSLAEDEQLPDLLGRYGRKYILIADHLKTKTVEEVERHVEGLIANGRANLASLANAADFRLQEESQSDELGLGSDSSTPHNALGGSPGDNWGESATPQGPVSLIQPTEHPAPIYIQAQAMQESTKTNHPDGGKSGTLQPHPNIGDSIDRPVRNKRRPRPRALCPYCSRYKDGLHDEYALDTHIKRIHRSRRKVWICHDVSIDKRFLAKCKRCLRSQRYSSRHYASKHLRAAHFSMVTPADTLRRWTQEIEERNPNYIGGEPQKTVSDASSDPPDSFEGNKRRKTDGALTLPGISSILSAINRSNSDHKQVGFESASPDMLNRPPHLTSEVAQYPNTFEDDSYSLGLPATLDKNYTDVFDLEALPLDAPMFEAEEAHPDDSAFKGYIPDNQDIFPDAISFFSHLSDNTANPANIDGAPHRTSRDVIQPIQVQKLPNLDPTRKTACQDQVDAIYQILDNHSIESDRYKVALEDLTSLSDTLWKDFCDWQTDNFFIEGCRS